jgi:anti-anti-sigma factor
MIESLSAPDGTMTLRITGRFNFSCYREFHDKVAKAQANRFVVDLSKVEYMDSSALGMLLLLREKVKEDASRVQIVSGAGQPHEVLRLANFQRLFTVV